MRRVGIPAASGLRGLPFGGTSVPATSLPRVATSGGASLSSGVLAPFSSNRISVPDKRYVSSEMFCLWCSFQRASCD